MNTLIEKDLRIIKRLKAWCENNLH